MTLEPQCTIWKMEDLLEKKSNPKQPSCKKKMCVAPKKAIVKKDVKSKVAAKNLIMTIQVNLCCLLHVSLGFGAKFT